MTIHEIAHLFSQKKPYVYVFESSLVNYFFVSVQLRHQHWDELTEAVSQRLALCQAQEVLCPFVGMRHTLMLNGSANLKSNRQDDDRCC